MQRFQAAMLTGYYSLVLTIPMFVFAQGGGVPKSIVPCNGVDCEVCHLATLAQNLLNTGIFIFIFVAALLFAYAGFLYLTNEAIGQQQKARSIFKNVALGLIILLSSWLVVDTLMKSVLGNGQGGTANFGPWNDICSVLPSN